MGTKAHILAIVRIIVLVAAASLVVVASVDVFHSLSFFSSAGAVKLQRAICLIMLGELLLEFFMADNKWRYAVWHMPFVLLCIPYSSLLGNRLESLPEALYFVLQLLPVLRSIFVLGDLLRALRFGSIVSLSGAYVTLLAAILYFSSLIFFVAEYGHNPEVHSFRSAVYWAVMSMTTTGCNITETTAAGEVVAVVLAATGLVLFPVFTVYVAAAIARATHNSRKAGEAANQS